MKLGKLIVNDIDCSRQEVPVLKRRNKQIT